jgi:hypothetical protein
MSWSMLKPGEDMRSKSIAAAVVAFTKLLAWGSGMVDTPCAPWIVLTLADPAEKALCGDEPGRNAASAAALASSVRLVTFIPLNWSSEAQGEAFLSFSFQVKRKKWKMQVK